MTQRAFWNPEMETISTDALHQVEGDRLRRQVTWMWDRSPFYRVKLQAAGIDDPRAITRESLSLLPFTIKAEIRETQEELAPLGGHACVPLTDVVRIHASSGTTGRPTLVGATRADIDMWNELVARTMWAQGVRPGSRAWIALMISWWIAGVSFLEGLEHLGATVLPAGNSDPARAFAVIGQIGVDYAISTPSFMTFLANFARDELGIDVRTLGLAHIGVGGEPGGGIPKVRRRLEETWGAQVYDGMGTADFCTNVWTECEYQDGMHFLGQGLIIPEILDPETSAPVPISTGVVGELVYTAIQRECVPLLRFRIGDLVRIEHSEPCSCGRSGYRIRCVGRVDDMLIVQGVNVYPSAIVDVVEGFRPRVTGELLICAGDGPQVEPPVRIRVEHGDDPGDLDALATDVAHEIRRRLMFRARIELVAPGSLAPTGGMKHKLVSRSL